MIRQKIKRAAGLCAGGAAAVLLCTGCADSTVPADTETVDQQTASGQQQTAGGNEGLTLTNYNFLISEDFIAAFEEKYPEVELEIISYGGANGSGYARLSLEHGDIPDIYISTQNFSRESQEKYLLDLSNYDFVNRYSESLLVAQDVNGAIYLLPCGYQMIGINYNKTILAENGWKVPEDFEQFAALAGQIEEAGYQAVGNGMNLDGYPFNYFMNLGSTMYFGTPEGAEWKAKFLKGEAKAAGNEGLKAIADYYKKWVDNGLIKQENMDRIRFLEGESVFYLGLGIPEYKKTTEDGRTYEFGIMPWLGEDAADNMLCRSVSRYIGLNRSLAEPGNEKKLADALKFLDFISTTEGQQALLVNINDIPSLHGNEIPEESPYREVADMIYSGRTAPVVYIGWEQLMIPMAQEIKRMMRGEIGTEELLMAFDSMNESMLAGESKEIFGTAAHTLTLEKTAQLVAVAEGRAVDADCALISLNGDQGSHWGNRFGLGWYLYEGGIDAEAVNLIRPVSSTVSVLEMTGAQIRELRDAGFDIDGNGNPYPYLLFTKGDAELEDETVYRLAVSSAELTEEMQTQATKTEVSPAGAIEEYVRSLGTVSGETIVWEADETP